MLAIEQAFTIVKRSISDLTGVPFFDLDPDSTIEEAGISGEKRLLLGQIITEKTKEYGYKIDLAELSLRADTTIRELAYSLSEHAYPADEKPQARGRVMVEETGGSFRAIITPKEARADDVFETGDKQEPAPKKDFIVVPVFYATDRGRTGSRQLNEFYGPERGEFELGICEVSIPKNHVRGEMERPRWWKLQFKENPGRHIVILSILPKPRDEFYGMLKESVAKSSEQDAFVFVHGFNVTFAEGARRTAQLAFDLSFKGAPILYSWPSQGKLAGYLGDEDSVKRTVKHLVRFLNEVAKNSGARKLHLIAHSMGNRALTDALKAIAQTGEAIHFNQIILTAPDIDAEIFEQDIAPAIQGTSERITLYASSRDKALAASRKIRGPYPRAGESGEGIVVVDGVDTVDASEIKTDLLGHGYFADTAPLINDIFLLIRHGHAPGGRNLSPVEKRQKRYWMLPKSK